MHLQQVARAVASVGRAAVPDLAAEDDAVAGFAEDAAFALAFPCGVPVGAAAGAVAARYEVGRTDRRVDVVEVEMGGGDKDRDSEFID